MGRYGAGTRNIRKDQCGFCEKDGFSNCQHLFQEKKDEHRVTYKRGRKST